MTDETEANLQCMNGYIYIVQTPEYMGTDVYKVGRTSEFNPTTNIGRVRSYPRGSRVLYLSALPPGLEHVVERVVLSEFTKKYTLVRGNEWFQGSFPQMKEDILRVESRLITDPIWAAFTTHWNGVNQCQESEGEESVETELVEPKKGIDFSIDMWASANTHVFTGGRLWELKGDKWVLSSMTPVDAFIGFAKSNNLWDESFINFTSLQKAVKKALLDKLWVPELPKKRVSPMENMQIMSRNLNHSVYLLFIAWVISCQTERQKRYEVSKLFVLFEKFASKYNFKNEKEHINLKALGRGITKFCNMPHSGVGKVKSCGIFVYDIDKAVAETKINELKIEIVKTEEDIELFQSVDM